MKDYIEVNSSIALALQGLGEGLKGLNFKKETLKDKLPSFLTIDIGSKKDNTHKKNGLNLNFDMNLKGKLTRSEQTLLRIAYGLLMFIIVYSAISIFLNNSMTKKAKEIEKAMKEANSQIELINNDISRIKFNKSKYKEMTKRLTDLNASIEEKRRVKNAIPTLLNQIMFSIPKGVQITSIENINDTRIVINAQANTYDQLGYLKASIKNYNILINVVSDSGQKNSQEAAIMTTIEGDLPI